MSPVPQEMYPMLLRKFTWDLVPCPLVQQYMPILGLVPASAEGADVEHADSHRRVAMQDPVQDKVQVYTAMSARVLAALALALHQGPEPDEIVAMVTGQFAQTLHVGTSVVIAHLIDQGYLQFGPKIAEEAGNVGLLDS